MYKHDVIIQCWEHKFQYLHTETFSCHAHCNTFTQGPNQKPIVTENKDGKGEILKIMITLTNLF